ncbi:MAG: hypothetical protein AAGF10_00760 [Verrucomicrobiota bacterium]
MEISIQEAYVKIAFLCGCLEPGRDGVGDCTLMLAQACQDAGHDTRCFALRDPYAKDGDAGRFGDVLENYDESASLAKALQDYAPEWISLQLVLYALEPRGLPLGLPRLLSQFCGSWRWQIMFHEIWIGCKVGTPLKERAIGKLQKHIIKRAVQAIDAEVVHTHALPYRTLLQQAGIPAQTLPLFGSIPIAEKVKPVLPDGLADNVLLGGVFGTLHPEWPPEPLLTELRAAAKEAQRPVALIHFGGIGPGKALWQALMQHSDEHLSLHQLGLLELDAASALMQRLDFAVASSPRALIEKSGSAANLLDHGVPVIINRDDARYPGVAANFPLPDELLIDGTNGLAKKLFRLPKRRPLSRLDEIASLFLRDLER